jgi:hypothetical protein
MKKQTKKLTEPVKKFYSLGCCGIDCGLCPRYYTDGESKCPGCFGPGFSEKHPPCSIATCCVKKCNLEVCGQCEEYPCKKYENRGIEKDSFVSHKKMLHNLKYIQENGIEKYIKELNIRIKLLERLLLNYNDGKNKSYFCIASRLLDIQDLNEGIKKAEKEILKSDNVDLKNKANIIKGIFTEYASKKNIQLVLEK